MSAPIQKSFLSAGADMSSFLKFSFPGKDLQTTNQNLVLKNQELLSEISQMSELKKENETLRHALDIGLNEEFKLAFATVTSKDPFQDSILINKGKNQGIQDNMPVLTETKVVLGKVSEVYDDFSKVLLISDKSMSFDAQVYDSETKGVIKGEGNQKLMLDLVPQDKELKIGDLIITSSLGGIFPKGLVVGEIQKIEKNDIRPYQVAQIFPYFSLTNLQTVFVATSF